MIKRGVVVIAQVVAKPYQRFGYGFTHDGRDGC